MSRNALSASWRVLAILVLWAVSSGCTASAQADKPIPKAENGIIDLSSWSWKKDGIVPLNGEWSFEWLIAPTKLDGETSFEGSTLEVPGIWGNTNPSNETELKRQGCGKYGLTILHKKQKEMLAIRLPNISTAYQLLIDGKIELTRGIAGLNGGDTVPYQLPATVYFNANDNRTDLELIVANFDHRDGGIRTEIVIGNVDHIQKLQTKHAAQELIVLGCLIMIGFYHMGLYIVRRKEVANFMFSILCLFVGIRMGLMGEGYVLQWIDVMTWEFATRLEYISIVTAGWAGFAFFQSMYSCEIKRIWYKLSSWIAALLIISVLLLKPITFTSWLPVFQVYILIFSAKALVGLVLSAHRKREGAWLSLIGVAGLVLTIVNDMLIYNGWWISIDLLPFGLLFLIVMNSFIISLRFSLTYERAEQMSSELTEWNNSLEQKIEERTEELQRSYQTLEEAKVELERMEQSRTQLVSNISHDLRTPITLLQGYMEALKDNVISEPAQRDNTIKLMLSKVEGLNSLIQDLFDISVLEAKKVELTLENIPLADWKERLTEQYEMEMQSKGIDFSCALAPEETLSESVTIDVLRMDRVFANLLYNAVRYTPNGGTIRITMSTDSVHSQVEVLVEDSGAGIEPGDLPHIFDRFYKKDKSRHSSSGGSGLGLSIAKEIVELHGGTISAFNPQEGGSAFRILLPMTAK
ncbi:sensor histidine kinase [Cohnella herbarum]|uniref:histidine kinase n=1 Tax=Cohnella herbarum TaxID=2728023 RepID=A0A7Z2VGK9_9BACL|nr:sensor histidine kinase [Cohnella herbarum]QJD82499.1 hypothetical protein HH215_04380 [Cohnella herbarum]